MTATERELTTKGASTRDRIVAAARVMLLAGGYDGLVLRELADSLGITLGNLQYYFKTREALALHVLGVEGARDTALIEGLRETTDPMPAFRTVIRDMMARYRGDSGRLLLMLTDLAQHHRSFEELYEHSYAAFYPAFEALLAELRPGLEPAEVALRARIINALVEGSAFQTTVGEEFFARVLAEAEALALA
ncbi:MAG: TetR/AcrR family transcriptional regulator [Actinomycetota bacterium]